MTHNLFNTLQSSSSPPAPPASTTRCPRSRRRASARSRGCRCRSASCSKACCATATARRSPRSTCASSPTGSRTRARTDEIPFVVARVVLQDFTGVPLLADLAAMRNVAARHGQEPEGRSSRWCRSTSSSTTRCRSTTTARQDALDLNMKLEFKRNARALPVHEVGHAGVRHLQGRAAGHRHRAPGQPRVPGARRATRRTASTTPTRWSAPTATRR